MKRSLAHLWAMCGFLLIAQGQTYTTINTVQNPGGDCFCMSTIESRSAVWKDEGLTLASLQSGTLSWDTEVYLGDNDGGGFGIAFLIQQEGNDEIGASSHGNGYGGPKGVSPSVAVEIDTKYHSWHDPVGSNVDHMAIYLDADHLGTPLAGGVPLPNVEDGAYHSFNITWTYDAVTPANSTITAVLDGTYVISGSFDPATIFNNFEPIYIGFTGSTNDGNLNEQKVSFAALNDPNACSQVLSNPFPVELMLFDAEVEDQIVMLEWVTAQENNNDYFEILRSADGNYWESIGSLEGAGTTDIPQGYTYSDYLAVSGMNYYRLKQVDLNGQSSLSDIIEVELGFGDMEQLHLYPNPASDYLSVRFRDLHAAQDVRLRLFDAFGRLVYDIGVESVSPLSPDFQIPVGDLPPGLYILETETQTAYLSNRFLVK